MRRNYEEKIPQVKLKLKSQWQCCHNTHSSEQFTACFLEKKDVNQRKMVCFCLIDSVHFPYWANSANHELLTFADRCSEIRGEMCQTQVILLRRKEIKEDDNSSKGESLFQTFKRKQQSEETSSDDFVKREEEKYVSHRNGVQFLVPEVISLFTDEYCPLNMNHLNVKLPWSFTLISQCRIYFPSRFNDCGLGQGIDFLTFRAYCGWHFQRQCQ